MHSGDGFEFLKWRNRSNFSSLTVVVFTGNQYQVDIERALELGASTHIEKPMSFKELMVTTRQIWTYCKNIAAGHSGWLPIR